MDTDNYFDLLIQNKVPNHQVVPQQQIQLMEVHVVVKIQDMVMHVKELLNITITFLVLMIHQMFCVLE